MINEFFLDYKEDKIACSLFSNGNDILVVFANGFMQHKCEPEHFTTSMCKRLLSHNIDSLIFDYLGIGDSTGNYENVLLEDMQGSVNTILNYVSKSALRYKSIFFIGYGLGYTVLCKALSKHKIEVATSCIAINPFFIYERKSKESSNNCHKFSDIDIELNQEKSFSIDNLDVNSNLMFLTYCGIRFGEISTYNYYVNYFDINPKVYEELAKVKKGIYDLGVHQLILICENDLRLTVDNELRVYEKDSNFTIHYIKNGSIDYRTPMEKDWIFNECLKYIQLNVG